MYVIHLTRRPTCRTSFDTDILQLLLLDERLQGPHSISMSRPEVSKPYPKSGTSQLSFNKSGTLLLARFHATANTLHLFSFPAIGGHSSDRSDVALPKLKSVLIHRQSVTHAQWNPARKGSLAACCATGTIHFWSDEWVNEGDLDAAGEEVAECVGIPARKLFLLLSWERQ